MTIALLFGGQGTEAPGMGLTLARELPAADALLHHAGELAGVDAHRVLDRGGHDFARTSVVQPLVTAVGLGAWAALGELGLAPSHVAGHSLGEIAAWSAAGAFSPHAAIALAAARGRAMEREATRHPGGMVGVTGTGEEIAEHVRHGRAAGSLVVAAHNAPTEYTLSGDEAALAHVAARAKTTRLQVSGAWHSPAMEGAIDDVRAAVPPPAATRSAVVVNRTGAVADANDDVATLLADQLVRPVLWAATLQTLAAAGVDHIIVLGPGKLMRSLVSKNLASRMRISIVETPADVRSVASEARQ